MNVAYSSLIERKQILNIKFDCETFWSDWKSYEYETLQFVISIHSSFSVPLPNFEGVELGDANGTTGSDDDHAWNNVLVDEVDFVHAVERGRINRNDLHIVGCRSSG